MTEYKLIYFPVKGRVEADKIALELAGCKYEEEYVTLETWPDKKKQLLADGVLAFGQVPVMLHNGKSHNMYGDNDDEKWQIDMLVDGAVDLREIFVRATFSPEERVACRKKFVEEILPTWIGYFDKLKQKNPGDHFVGKKLSIADIAIFDILTIIEDIHKNTITKNANLKKFIDAFSSQPRYVEYRKSSKYHDLLSLREY